MHYGKDRKNRMVQEICKYVEDHLCEDLSHARLRAQFGLRPYDLTITFQKVTGHTLTNYIILLRLKTAIGKVEGGMGVEEAAFASGFRTYSHFYKVFVKYYGISPREYFSREKRMEREKRDL